MRIIKDDRNPMMTNSYLLILDNKDAYIIDASSKLNSFKLIIEEEKLNLKAILLTHAHYDHIMGLQHLKDTYGVDVVAHIEEKEVLNNPDINLSTFIGMNLSFDADKYLEGKEGDYNGIKYILTPGHTSGGLCFLIGNELFTGDTIFAGSIGRSDFPGGDYDTLIQSIKTKLLVLNPETNIYPGHGPVSQIGVEKASNPFLI